MGAFEALLETFNMRPQPQESFPMTTRLTPIRWRVVMPTEAVAAFESKGRAQWQTLISARVSLGNNRGGQRNCAARDSGIANPARM